MTLEASLVMPMVICIFALIIYFTYYLYGRCELSRDAYVLAFRASTMAERQDMGMDEYVEAKKEEVIGKKYFGTTHPRVEAEQQGKEIKVSASATTRHAAMGSFFLKPAGAWEIEGGAKAKERKYTEHIRKITRYKDIGKTLISGK